MTATDSPRGTSPGAALEAMRSGGLVPLYTSADPDDLYRAALAIVESGLSVMEVTLRAPGVLEALHPLITRVEQAGLPLMVGAGTVLDANAAAAAIAAGARFVFSPTLVPEVAEQCRAAEVAWIPGCATPSEIHTALRLGSSAVKLFPADTIGGPGFLRTVRSVLPTVEAIPSGGVSPDPDAIEAWFRAGAMAVAMGSWLFPGPGTGGEDWAEVQSRLNTAVSAVSAARERLRA